MHAPVLRVVGAPDPGTPGGSARHTTGERIAGHLVLLRQLAVGGMGSIWVARHERLGVDVALKFVRVVGDGMTTERLLREARAVAGIQHPAVVRVFDVIALAGGDPCIVMELLDGATLAEELGARGRLDTIEAVRLLLPIVGALAVAHDHGVIHRDVKPENVVLARTPTGVQPTLVDFGVARLLGARRITRTGVFVGTPDYGSPEQVLGTEVDARCDVWAVGAVLYECVTGHVPFEGATHTEVLRSILQVEPAPLTGVGVDPQLWSVVRRALAKRLDDRWPSMQELGAALAGYLLERGVTEDSAGSSVRAAWSISSTPSTLPTEPAMVRNIRGSMNDTLRAPKPRRSPSLQVALASLGLALAIAVTLAFLHLRSPGSGVPPPPAARPPAARPPVVVTPPPEPHAAATPSADAAPHVLHARHAARSLARVIAPHRQAPPDPVPPLDDLKDPYARVP